jgi:hypothetical protein
MSNSLDASATILNCALPSVVGSAPGWRASYSARVIAVWNALRICLYGVMSVSCKVCGRSWDWNLPSVPGGEAFFLKVPVMPFCEAQYLFRLDFEIHRLRLLLFGEGSIEEDLVELEGCIESEVRIE